jgi:DNA-damage-inducible protein J
MAQTNINVRVDEDVKKKAEDLFGRLGFNVSTAVNIFLRKSLSEHGLPFDVNEDPFYSPANMERLQHSIQQMKQGNVVVKSMDELEKMADE